MPGALGRRRAPLVERGEVGTTDERPRALQVLDREPFRPERLTLGLTERVTLAF